MGDKFRALSQQTSGSSRTPERDVPLRRAKELREATWRREMLTRFHQKKASLDFIYAFERTGNFVTSENRDEWSAKELKEWDGLLRKYSQLAAREERIIDLCFCLQYELGRDPISRQRRFAASEFGVAVASAHEQGISSFTVEQIFRESWLDAVVRLNRGVNREWDPTDRHRFDHVDAPAVRNVLYEVRDELAERQLRAPSSGASEKLIAKIEAARVADGSWFGKPPAPGQEGEGEMAFVVDEIQHAISRCEQQGVPEDLIESMLLRSWVRMLVFNEHADERFFHILDKYWEQVHAAFQIRMAGYSGLRLQ